MKSDTKSIASDDNKSIASDDTKSLGLSSDNAMAASLFTKMVDLEASWVGCITTLGREEDAKFIADQIIELQAFISVHREHLGVDMMPEAFGVLLSALSSDEVFQTKILPMLKAKAERDGCSIETAYRELTLWTRHSTEESGRPMKELLMELHQSEAQLHKEYFSALKKNKQTRQPPLEEREANQASAFKPIATRDKDGRLEDDEARKKGNRNMKLKDARSKAVGWMNNLVFGGAGTSSSDAGIGGGS